MKTFVHLRQYLGEFWQNEKCLIENYREIENTHFMLHKVFPEIVIFHDTAWKNKAGPDSPQMTICLCNMEEKKCIAFLCQQE